MGGGGGGKGGGSKYPPVVQTFVEPARAVVDTAVQAATAVVDTTKDVAKAVGDTAYDIKKNPTVAAVLPVIETAALVTVGVPPPVASAAVAAANGASVEQIATSAAASYVGGQAGGAAGTAAASAGADAVTANIVGSAAGSATKTALQGGSAEDVLKAAAGGAAGSGVGSFAAGQGADLSTVKGIEQATGTLATTGDPTKALVAGGGGYLTQEARDSIKQPPAPVEDRSTTAPTTTAEAPLTLDQQLAQMIQQEQAKPIDRSQDVQVADIGRIGDPGSGVYYDPSVGAYRVSDVEPSQEPLIEPTPTEPVEKPAPTQTIPELPPVVTEERAVSPDDLAIIDLISQQAGTTPSAPATAPVSPAVQPPPAVEPAVPPAPAGEAPSLPEVTTTAPREIVSEDLALVGDVSAPAAGGAGAGGAGTAGGAGGTAGVGGTEGGVSQGTLPPVTVTGTPEISADDLAIIDLITPREVGTLPEVTITPGPEEPERDFDFPDLTEEGEAVTETEVAPDEKATPYKPELFITGSKSRKPYQPRTTTRLGGVAAFAPQTGLSQALTAVRPAGETEGTGTGKERQQVWNEASLRLKDALGL